MATLILHRRSSGGLARVLIWVQEQSQSRLERACLFSESTLLQWGTSRSGACSIVWGFCIVSVLCGEAAGAGTKLAVLRFN